MANALTDLAAEPRISPFPGKWPPHWTLKLGLISSQPHKSAAQRPISTEERDSLPRLDYNLEVRTFSWEIGDEVYGCEDPKPKSSTGRVNDAVIRPL